MKKLLAIAATLAASSAFAGVKLEVRSDYVNTPNYDDQAGTSVAGTSVFTPAVARLYLSGNVGDAQVDSGWNLRAFTPEMNGTTLSKTMTVDKFVDHLWIAKSMGDWTFKAGKLEVNTGGFEHAKIVHGDTYLTSLAAGGVGGKQTAASTSANVGSVTSPENSSGVSAAYTINPEHKLEFQVMNSTNAQTIETGAASTDKRHNMGLAYMGSFLNKMIQANLSYIIGSGDTITTGATTGHEQTFMSAGLRFLPMENLTVDVDYLANTDKNSTTSKKDETNSTILEARYAMGMYTPVLKYEMSTDKLADADNFKRDAWALALEVAPKADEAFRYHVAFASVKDKDFGAGKDDVTQNVITVGIKYNGDIVK